MLIKNILKIISIVGILSFTYCENPKLEPGQPVDFDSIQKEEFEPKMEQGLEVGKNISIEGYLGLKESMSFVSSTIQVNLYEQKERQGKKISVSISIGDKANQIQSLPDSYKFDDLKVKSNTNEIISPTDKVRVHGMRMGSASDDTIYIETTYIEKI